MEVYGHSPDVDPDLAQIVAEAMAKMPPGSLETQEQMDAFYFELADHLRREGHSALAEAAVLVKRLTEG